MLAHAREAHELVRSLTRADFAKDRVLRLAVTHLLQIVGEAASRVSPETRARIEALPWVAMIGMRHHVVHGYGGVDDELIWIAAKERAVELIAALQPYLVATPPKPPSA